MTFAEINKILKSIDKGAEITLTFKSDMKTNASWKKSNSSSLVKVTTVTTVTNCDYNEVNEKRNSTMGVTDSSPKSNSNKVVYTPIIRNTLCERNGNYYLNIYPFMKYEGLKREFLLNDSSVDIKDFIGALIPSEAKKYNESHKDEPFFLNAMQRIKLDNIISISTM